MALAGAASQRGVAHGILLRIAGVLHVDAGVVNTVGSAPPWPGRPFPNLCLGARGGYGFQVVFYGKSAHAAPPEKGCSALVDVAKVVTKLERIEYVEDPYLGKGSYCVAERHPDGGACSVPDYAVIKLFRHIVQGEGPATIVREIDEAIQALPEGYDTVCTDGMFSQGEWQLLSIARAAAADPAVLLLDEITANLDAETEARVREALRQASRGRTVLSVSHRIYESFGGRTVEIRPQGQ